MTDEYLELSAADLAERWRPRPALESLADTASQPAGEEYADAETALRWMRTLSWSHLQEARERALNGSWSIECANIVDRIVGLTTLVGPEPWGSVSVDLILNGWYERLHEVMGVPTPLAPTERARAQQVHDRRFR